MPVYNPLRASATAHSWPQAAGAGMYVNGRGSVGYVGEVAPKRQTKHLIVAGIALVVSAGIVFLASRSSGNRGLSGIGDGGDIKLTRSLPAK